MFPEIYDINDILPYIKGYDNFSVNTKIDLRGNYIVIDYNLNTPDMFLNTEQKECRGIIFFEDGSLMSRPMQKFFNFNEREETKIENIDFSKRHWILEKLDGSLIRPLWFPNKEDGTLETTWGSKAGITFLSPQIEEFVDKHRTYKMFANLMFHMQCTPCFEWCSRQNRIVLDYPEDRLVLLAIRKNHSGEYFSYEQMKAVAESWHLDYVQEYQGTITNMEYLYDLVRDMKGIEGFVLRFEDGLMVKMKSEEYILHHKAKNSINLEKNVISILVNGNSDDFKSLLTKEDKERFELFENDFWQNINNKVIDYRLDLSIIYDNKLTRKDYALKYSKLYNHSPLQMSIMFTFFGRNYIDISEIKEEIINRIKKNCNTQTGIDKVRELFGNIYWNDYNNSWLVAA